MPKGIPNKRYTPEFKAMVVETMRKEKLSYCEAARQFEVPSDTRIASWERIYLIEGPEGLAVERRGRARRHTPNDLGGGAEMTEQERADALKVVASVITRCARVQPRFVPGAPQHTLLKNRIQALTIAEALLAGRGAALYATQDLSAALEPLASAIRKCEKARSKYEPGSGQYGRYGGTIRALALSRALVENELLGRSL